MRVHSVCIWAIVAGAVLLGLTESVRAGISIISQSIQVNELTRQVSFNLLLNQTPDFAVTDSVGRHQDAFQYQIVPDALSYVPQETAIVIRGEEIGTGSLLPIRGGYGSLSDPDPASGGWGAIIGTVPFDLTGNDLTFSVSFNTLGTTNGIFAYEVFTTNFGAQVSDIVSASVPLPPTCWTGFLGCLLCAVGIRYKSHLPIRSRRASKYTK